GRGRRPDDDPGAQGHSGRHHGGGRCVQRGLCGGAFRRQIASGGCAVCGGGIGDFGDPPGRTAGYGIPRGNRRFDKVRALGAGRSMKVIAMKLAMYLGTTAVIVVLVCQAVAALAQDTNYHANGQQIPPPACYTAMEAFENLRAGVVPAPCTQQTHDEWLKDVQHWREERRIRIGYDGARYGMPEMKWAWSS